MNFGLTPFLDGTLVELFIHDIENTGAGATQAPRTGSDEFRAPREMDYRLVPGPLAEVYGGWLATFVPVMENSLRELKLRAEAD